MKTKLYVYTGTGNSLWIARQLALEMNEATLEFMPNLSKDFRIEADKVGFIFPVHIWGLPHRVIQFVNHLQVNPSTPRLEGQGLLRVDPEPRFLTSSLRMGLSAAERVKPETYFFALAVNAGQVAATLLQMKKLMSARQFSLALGYSAVMPTNYIPWGGPGPIEAQQRLFSEAQEKVKAIAGSIIQGEQKEVDRGPLWQNILFSWFYKMSFRQVHKMDKNFWVDDKCDSCGICSKVCPADNIEMISEKPVWLHRCEQCFACIQWCPEKAIQHGKRTPKYQRYHHPQVTLNDILDQAETSEKVCLGGI
jgi:ferredoxin